MNWQQLPQHGQAGLFPLVWMISRCWNREGFRARISILPQRVVLAYSLHPHALSASPPLLSPFLFLSSHSSFQKLWLSNSWLPTLLCVHIIVMEEGCRGINLYGFWILVSVAINSPTGAFCSLLPCQPRVVHSLLLQAGLPFPLLQLPQASFTELCPTGEHTRVCILLKMCWKSLCAFSFLIFGV